MTGIQWVLDGNITEAQKRLKSAEKWMRAGNSVLLSFISIAVMLTLLGMMIRNPVLIAIAMLNVFGGTLIGFPLVFFGGANLTKAKRLISPGEADTPRAIEAISPNLVSTSPTAELATQSERGSITEHTTLHLTKENLPR